MHTAVSHCSKTLEPTVYVLFAPSAADEARFRAWSDPELRKRKRYGFTVKTQDGAEIRTTQEHLLGHSVFFEQLFNSSFDAAEADEVVLQGVPKAAAEALVEATYSGKARLRVPLWLGMLAFSSAASAYLSAHGVFCAAAGIAGHSACLVPCRRLPANGRRPGGVPPIPGGGAGRVRAPGGGKSVSAAACAAF